MSTMQYLIGGLWHATSEDRFKLIVASGAIQPEPDLPDSERWGTANGLNGYPYTRMIGGVSLFDFENFNENKYEREFPASNWRNFTPYNGRWTRMVWIEINRTSVQSNLVSPKELLRKRKENEAYRHRLMPHIESAHLGRIPISNFLRILSTNKCSVSIFSSYAEYLNGKASDAQHV